jgi:hypothetical protein
MRGRRHRPLIHRNRCHILRRRRRLYRLGEPLNCLGAMTN